MGNVLIDIDPPRTYQAFGQLANLQPETVRSIFNEKKIFHRTENGEVPPTMFHGFLRNTFNIPEVTDRQIDTAWNALLLPMKPERLARVQELSKSYRVFLLSNTNPFHLGVIVEEARMLGYDFPGLFETMFLSFEMDFYKPDPEFYTTALRQKGLLAEESVFIDDLFDNITSAAGVGLGVIHLNPIGSLLEKIHHF